MRKLLAVLFLAVLPLVAGADDAPGTPASEAVNAKPQASSKKKLKSFKEFGDELGKVGKKIGKSTVNAAKSTAAKVSSDVKNKNFQPKTPADPPAGGQDRGGTN